MWHEARKQEKKIRGMMVDYKKRAERRREFYEKTKADPTQFIQIHGRRCKIHLDPAVAQAADSPLNMMPWQGQSDNLIDRFDGRAHLDIIPECRNKSEPDSNLTTQQQWEERQTNYERYRILVENDFIGISEEKFLQQIYLEEQFGPINKSNEDEKKKLSEKKAAIGYVYEDSSQPAFSAKDDEEAKKDSDSEIDLDVIVDVGALTSDQAKEMNEHSIKYGMVSEDFITLMTRDKEEAESLRLAKEAEEEKAMYSGRKSRRERRAFREKKLLGRKISPPSYAARESPSKENTRSRSTTRSRSRSPVDAGKITFITSFGGEASEESGPDNNKPVPVMPTVGVTQVTPVRKSNFKLMEVVQRPSSPLPTTSSAYKLRPTVEPNSSRNSNFDNSAAVVVGTNRSRSRSSSRSDSTSPVRSRRRERYHDRYRSSSHRDRHSVRRREYRKTSSRSRTRSSSSRSYSSRSPPSSYSSHSSRSSRSRSSRSRSSSHSSSPRRRAQSPKRYYSRTKSRSRSPNGRSSPTRSTASTNTSSGSTVPKVRYYGRKKTSSDSTVSSASGDDVDKTSQQSRTRTTPSAKNKNVVGKAGYGTKKCTPRERLKRRMQLALNKQYKADKQAEMRKAERQEQERQDREEELRDLAIKLRRRERERRHQRRHSTDRRGRSRSYSSQSRSRSRSRTPSSDSSFRSRSTRSSRKSRNADRSSSSSSSSSSNDSSDSDSRKESRPATNNKRSSTSPLVRY